MQHFVTISPQLALQCPPLTQQERGQQCKHPRSAAQVGGDATTIDKLLHAFRRVAIANDLYTVQFLLGGGARSVRT
ncbi:hypothetical protein A7X94_05430 [Stenotrophomonas maltophilia]|nr:hypothetical protein VL21_09015 [Stenotrophomonas maltophilia]PZT39111.1 hypothetical protein A7X94_05430 [Stenotrophomonas maltophilia]